MDWSAFLSTFALIFVAELGDKTQLAVVTQTCKYRRPLPVFAGASLALSVVTALGVVGGQALRSLIPGDGLQTAAAIAFIVMGAIIWRQSAALGRASGEGAETCEDEQSTPAANPRRGPWDWRAFTTTLALLLVAEMGDKTQLAVVALTGNHVSPAAVLAGGVLALSSVSALGVLGGRQLCKLIPERQLLRISAAAFVVMGALMALRIL